MKQFCFVLLTVFGVILLFSAPAFAATSDRTATTISINITPAEPQEGDDFTVTGILQTDTGEILGNKYVYLDSTKAGKQPGTLQPLWQTKTSTTGTYFFYRPASSPAEELRVRFDGTTQYSNCTSTVVTIRK